MALNRKDMIFMMHMAVFCIMNSNIYPFQYAQITLPKVEKIIIPSKYADETNVFSLFSVAELSKHISINNSYYDLIYSLGPMKLKTFHWKKIVRRSECSEWIRDINPIDCISLSLGLT